MVPEEVIADTKSAEECKDEALCKRVDYLTSIVVKQQTILDQYSRQIQVLQSTLETISSTSSDANEKLGNIINMQFKNSSQIVNLPTSGGEAYQLGEIVRGNKKQEAILMKNAAIQICGKYGFSDGIVTGAIVRNDDIGISFDARITQLKCDRYTVIIHPQ